MTAPTETAAPRRAWRPWRTIRFRITVVALAAVLVLLGASAVALVQAQRSQLLDDVDDDVATELARLTADLQRDGPPATMPVLGEDVVAQVVDADGTIVVESEDLAEEDGVRGRLLAPPGSGAAAELDDDGELDGVDVRAVRLPDGESARAATVTVRAPSGLLTVTVARSDVDVDDAVDALVRTLAVAVPVVAVLLAATTWVLVGRTLRPVDDIRRRVQEIEGDDLTVRLPEPGTDDEIDDLARTMNSMLDRLEHAARREQEFTSDAAHELRTPLARMRLALEVDRDHPDTADPAATSQSLLEEVTGMQALVDDLLQLARGDAPAAPPVPVDLDQLTEAEVAAVPADGPVAVDISGVEPVQVLGEPGALAQVVRNLLDNALRHARSTVAVSVRREGDRAELVVADDGPGIPPADRERVFRRFVRLDDSRTAGTGGTGLGLSIVAAIVRRHGGTIEVRDREGGGTAMVVRLPSPGA